jgi:FkbM family methyltransferase
VIDRFEKLYNKTLRHTGPLHHLIRMAVWRGGEYLVALVSAMERFELPADVLLPVYKLEMLLGTYESETVRVCKQCLHTGMTAIDIGAHAGYFTFLFSRLVGPTGKVFAFEPHPTNFHILQNNVTRHRLTNVVMLQKAVSDTNSQATFYATPLSVGHSLLPVKSYAEQFSVETVALDDFLHNNAVREVGLIKMDVEANEPEVLDGLKDFARRASTLSRILECKPSLLR